MIRPVERLKGLVVVVFGVAAILVVVVIVVAVLQMREIGCAFVDARSRAADLQLSGLAPRWAIEGVGFVLVHLEVSSACYARIIVEGCLRETRDVL